jgi:hypothetical protein
MTKTRFDTSGFTLLPAKMESSDVEIVQIDGVELVRERFSKSAVAKNCRMLAFSTIVHTLGRLSRFVGNCQKVSRKCFHKMWPSKDVSIEVYSSRQYTYPSYG